MLETKVDEASMKKFIPPLSIQMLVENIVKHNVVSVEDPVRIEIFAQNDGFLTVRNNLHPKNGTGTSLQSGLRNISKRYNYLSGQVPQVVNNGKHFSVRLPLLGLEPF